MQRHKSRTEVKLIHCFKNVVGEGQWQSDKSEGWVELSLTELLYHKNTEQLLYFYYHAQLLEELKRNLQYMFHVVG